MTTDQPCSYCGEDGAEITHAHRAERYIHAACLEAHRADLRRVAGNSANSHAVKRDALSRLRITHAVWQEVTR